MGITDFLSSAMEYLNITEVAHADAPEKDDEDEGSDEKEEKDGGDDAEEKEDGGDGDDEEKDEGGDDDAEEEEEEEEEPVDPKPALEEGKSLCYKSYPCIRVYPARTRRLTRRLKSAECAKSSQCRGYKHHYDECVERVTAHENDPEAHKGHPKEDCVEECEF